MPPILRSALLACVLTFSSAAVMAADQPPLTQGQTVYVPIYSHVLHGNQDRRGKPDIWLLSAMLSIRNTDPANPITVRSIRYYDTDGNLVRDDLPEAKKLAPLGTTEVFVEHRDTTGGSGANFLVVWDSEKAVNAPVVEAVHTNFFGTQSVAFVTNGQALRINK